MLKKYAINFEKENLFQYLIITLLVAIYGRALFIPLIDKDAAHHANIAINMLQHNDYLSLIDREKDYLDKPHLLFWASLLSFKIFGITTFAHRLPALLFSLLSVYSTYKVTKHLSDKTTAKIAALILATAQAFILSITDARMETPLTAFIIFGLWQLVLYIDRQKFIHLTLGALGAAGAFSTKGWIGVVIILIACFFKLLLEHKWNVLGIIKTWLFIPLFFLFISPVLYAYYYQFDLHPEKVIRGMSHISGVKFILWNQNFERFKGDNWVEGGRNSSPFFLYHTFLWAFLPWCVAAYLAVFYWLRRILFKKKWRNPFNFAALTFAFVLFTISFSKFKMPHYVIMLFPLAAIFTAPYLRLALSHKMGIRIFYPLHIFIAIGVLLITLALNFYFFTPSVPVAITGCLILLTLIVLIFRRTEHKGLKVLTISAFISIGLNYFMNFNFLPNLMEYQGGQKLAEKVKAKNIPHKDILLLENDSHSFDFYLGYNHKLVSWEQLSGQSPEVRDKFILLTSSMKRELEKRGLTVKPEFIELDYRVSKVKLKFLNRKTRLSVCDSLILGKIYR